jgi:hypothetical protein
MPVHCYMDASMVKICSCGHPHDWLSKLSPKQQWDAHIEATNEHPSYDLRDQSKVSDFEKWWLALCNSDDPLAEALDDMDLVTRAVLVAAARRAFDAARVPFKETK